MWSRNKANLYIQDALNEFEPDFKHHCLSPPAQHRMYRQKLMLTHLVGFGGGAVSSSGTSYYMDSSNDYLSLADNAAWRCGGDGDGNFTVDFWFKSASYAIEMAFGQIPDNNNFWIIAVDTDSGGSQYVFRVRSSTVDEVNYVPATFSQAIDTWYHFALIRGWGGNANDYMMTADGVPMSAAHTDTFTIPDYAAPLRIGGETNQSFYNGWIDEIRYSNNARWTADFSASLPTVPYSDDANTLLLVHCNEPILSGTTGSGATFADSSSNARTVTEQDGCIRSTADFKFAD